MENHLDKFETQKDLFGDYVIIERWDNFISFDVESPYNDATISFNLNIGDLTKLRDMIDALISETK